jgi:PAS domain S-box-containing protein
MSVRVVAKDERLLPEGDASTHAVQFYRDEALLADGVASFLADGLAGGESVVLIASSPHTEAFLDGVRVLGIDIEQARQQRRLIVADAAEVLARLGGPILDASRFAAVVGELFDQVRPGWPIRAYGEMVDLLWRAGNRAAAFCLEALWSQLAKTRTFSLLCAYDLGGFPREADAADFDAICGCHTTTHPTPELAALEQRSAALAHEVAERRRVELLLDSISDHAVFMLDPEGRVVTWNAGAERIKGWSADEIIGRHFSVFYPPSDAQAGKCALELRAVEQTGRFADESWRVRKDGSRFWASVVINAVRGPDGKLLGFSKVTRDLTERHQADAHRAALAATAEANRAKDEFLAMLGHELRNPLAPIVTALQLIKLRGDEKSSKEQIIIERQVQHVVRLVDDLLDVSRITQGKIELKKETFELAVAVAKAVEIVSPLLEQRRHVLTVDVSRVGMRLHADLARLTQVIVHLLANAAKFTDLAGRIELSAWRDGHEVVLRVEDNGSGIVPELLPRLFDLFVQGLRSADRSQGGLGIGLSLVRSLVQLHGGTVVALSDGPGHGSTFVMRVPAAAEFERAACRQDQPLPVTALPRRVLVVDDNVDAATMLGELCETVGHKVKVAFDGPQALMAIDGFAPEIAILDIGLPVMDGYELAKQMRKRLGAACRLVALTGYGQEHDRRRSGAAGFDAHLVKPIEPAHLLELIQT